MQLELFMKPFRKRLILECYTRRIGVLELLRNVYDVCGVTLSIFLATVRIELTYHFRKDSSILITIKITLISTEYLN